MVTPDLFNCVLVLMICFKLRRHWDQLTNQFFNQLKKTVLTKNPRFRSLRTSRMYFFNNMINISSLLAANAKILFQYVWERSIKLGRILGV